MFENQLLKISGLEHQGKLVKAANLAREFDAAHQIDCYIDTVFTQIIQEAVLYVLGVLCIVVHFPNRLSVLCLFVYYSNVIPTLKSRTKCLETQL